MTDKKKKALFTTFNVLTATALFIIQYNGVFSIKIGGANPMLMLGLCVTYSMFSNELDGVLFSMILGFITDSASSGTAAFFNTLFFMSSLVLLFGNTEYLQGLMAGRGVIAFIIASVGVNAVVEMAVAAVVTGAVGAALKKAKLI